MSYPVKKQALPGARFAVVDEDPYGPTITFWPTWESAFEAWKNSWSNMGPRPLLLERQWDDIAKAHYYGALRDDAKNTLIEEYEA